MRYDLTMRMPLGRAIVVPILLVHLASIGLAASRQPVRARHGMVASVDEHASRIGIDVLKRGGNAVDAAVAVALALAVTWPAAGNLGGGGFMMVRRADGRAEVIDYRERAPLAATRDMYLDKAGNIVKGLSTDGHKAAGVPGTVAGLELAHSRHGKLKWTDLVTPARKLASDGFVVSYHLERSLGDTDNRRTLGRFAESNRIFLNGGRLHKEGSRLTQPDLARTLMRLEKLGAREFYEGRTSQLVLEEMQRGAGIVTARDLAGYAPTIREPLRGTYRGHEILTMPPPSSGGAILLEMLNMLEHYDVPSLGFHSSSYIHLVVEIMRRAFADRARFLGDTDFEKVPVTGLISKTFADLRRKDIQTDRATESTVLAAANPLAYESPETTHFTIVDAEGNVVSNTYTLNASYGSGVTVRGAGFLLNNTMDDFTTKSGEPNLYGLLQSEANAIAPRKRPLSAMTPTIVLRDGKVAFALGSPGGGAIINTVLQTIVNVIDFGMPLQAAVEAPRFHHQWMPDEIRVEPRGINRDTREALERKGHRFRPKEEEMGDAHCVMVDRPSGRLLGAADPRRGGIAIGY